MLDKLVKGKLEIEMTEDLFTKMRNKSRAAKNNRVERRLCNKYI